MLLEKMNTSFCSLPLHASVCSTCSWSSVHKPAVCYACEPEPPVHLIYSVNVIILIRFTTEPAQTLSPRWRFLGRSPLRCQSHSCLSESSSPVWPEALLRILEERESVTQYNYNHILMIYITIKHQLWGMDFFKNKQNKLVANQQ